MAVSIEGPGAEVRHDARKFALQLVAALGAAMAGGAGSLALILHLTGRL
jgi:hypothetical protein